MPEDLVIGFDEGDGWGFVAAACRAPLSEPWLGPGSALALLATAFFVGADVSGFPAGVIRFVLGAFPVFATILLTLVLAAFLLPPIPALGSSFFSVNSNAGLGRVRSCGDRPWGERSCGDKRVTRAAGFTPAAAAALATAGVNAGTAFALCCISGFTMIWLS